MTTIAAINQEVLENLIRMATNGSIFVIRREVFTATSGQTLFTLDDGSYAIGNNHLTVHVQGVFVSVINGNVLETSTTSFTVVAGATSGQKVEVEYLQGVELSTLEAAREVAEELRVTAEAERVVTTATLVSDAETAIAEMNTALTDANDIALSWAYKPNAYSGATQYYVNNTITYNGIAYICIVDSLNHLPIDTSFWRVFAQKGDTGATGSQGIQGIQGIQGDQGLNWEGAYSGATAYVVDDAVSYNGSSYICILASTGNLPTNSTYWAVLATKGLDGTGAGSVLSVSSANTDISITDPNNNPVLTLNSSIAATPNGIVKRDINSKIAGDILGNAATVTTNADLIGPVTSVGNATSLAVGSITEDKLAFNVATQAELDAHLADNTRHITAESVTRTITVGVGKDFTTIQTAINSIGEHIIRGVIITVQVDAGTYSETVDISGFFGGGSLEIRGNTIVATTHNVNNFIVSGCFLLFLRILGFNITTTTTTSLMISSSLQLQFQSLNIVAASAVGVQADKSPSVYIIGCVISNKTTAIFASINAHIFSSTNTGTGSQNGLMASDGGVIAKNGTQPAGTTAEVTSSGGVIR